MHLASHLTVNSLEFTIVGSLQALRSLKTDLECEEIKELLRDWQKEGREKMEAEKKAEAEERLKEVAAKPRQEDVSEERHAFMGCHA